MNMQIKGSCCFLTHGRQAGRIQSVHLPHSDATSAPARALVVMGARASEAQTVADTNSKRRAEEAARSAILEAPEDSTRGPPTENGEEELVEVEVTEYSEVEEVVVPRYQVIAQQTYQAVSNHSASKAIPVVAGALLLFAIGKQVHKQHLKSQTPEALKLKLISKNKMIADELNKILPGDRSKLSTSVVNDLAKKGEFTPVEVFRKYMWYVLRERDFNQDAVDDMIALKAAGGLSDKDVAEAMKERAERIYTRYGTLMVNTEGMTSAGVQRKATVKNLCSKLLYLAEHPSLVSQAQAVDLADFRKIFGATEEDMESVRITSLHNVDLEQLFKADSAGLASYTSDEEEQPVEEQPQKASEISEGSAQ